jgi:peptide/nickel transport system substrate-binding protein
MDKIMLRNKLSGLTLLLILALVIAACGSPAPAGSAEAPAAEAPAAGSQADAATPTPEAEAEDTTAANNAAVQGSGISQAGELKGISVTSDEDVSTLRTNYGGEYRSTSSSDAVSFHPYLTSDTASSSYQAFVYDSALLRLDEDTLDYVPHMAESYTISEDGLTFTFNLRDTLQWSDGTPLTAYDFQYGYDMATAPDSEFPYVSQLDFVESYVALDDYTLQAKIKEIYAPALGQISGLVTPLPRHIWENLDWKDPELNPEINSPTVVSGPYKLVEWKRDQYVIFEANENYWYKGRPNFDRYIIEIVPDQDISYQKMLTGEADTGIIQPDNLDEAKAQPNLNVYEWWPAAASWSYIGMNMREEGVPTTDVNVRRGISYAIDKDTLTEVVMAGQAKRQCSIYPETSWVYNPDVPCYDYDTDAAIAEFEKAGYTFDGSQMVDADGEQLTLKLIYGPNTSKIRERIAIIVQANLAEIGVNVEIQALEWASFLEATDATDPDWDMFISGWRSTIEPHIMYTIWEAASIPGRDGGNGSGLNAVGYDNPEVEALFDEAGKTYDNEFRIGKYQEIQRIVAEEAPYVFLFYQKAWSGQNTRIQGIIPKTLGIGWNSDDWYIEEAQ